MCGSAVVCDRAASSSEYSPGARCGTSSSRYLLDALSRTVQPLGDGSLLANSALGVVLVGRALLKLTRQVDCVTGRRRY